MKKEDENWLLSSISETWSKVRTDAEQGYVRTERDTISSFYRHLVPMVEKRNLNPTNGLGNLCVHNEVRVQLMDSEGKQRDVQYIDLAITTTKIPEPSLNSKLTPTLLPEPSRILVHFEFKFGWDYSLGDIRNKMIYDIEKMMNTGYKGWTMKVRAHRWSAETDFVVLCLVADKWDKHTKNGGSLHPKVAHGLLRLEDYREGLRYFELHGPFSVIHPLPDWNFFEINRDGQKRLIS